MRTECSCPLKVFPLETSEIAVEETTGEVDEDQAAKENLARDHSFKEKKKMIHQSKEVRCLSAELGGGEIWREGVGKS